MQYQQNTITTKNTEVTMNNNKQTAQEKAKELVNRFMFAGIYFTDGIDGARKNAKQCALIAVDEIIAQIEPSVSIDVISARIKYWEEVKQEIEKL